ncbi:hypothetical protein Hanom_Chr02g00143881 [Helianthus anomalus]
MRKKPVSYEWFSYIRISSQIRRKSRIVTHFLWKMVSEILIFLVVIDGYTLSMDYHTYQLLLSKSMIRGYHDLVNLYNDKLNETNSLYIDRNK